MPEDPESKIGSEALHSQLLELTRPLIAGEKYSVARLAGPLAALTAVLELHKPGTFFDRVICNHCEDSDESASAFIDWPCATVRVIASALGVET